MFQTKFPGAEFRRVSIKDLQGGWRNAWHRQSDLALVCHRCCTQWILDHLANLRKISEMLKYGGLNVVFDMHHGKIVGWLGPNRIAQGLGYFQCELVNIATITRVYEMYKYS